MRSVHQVCGLCASFVSMHAIHASNTSNALFLLQQYMQHPPPAAFVQFVKVQLRRFRVLDMYYHTCNIYLSELARKPRKWPKIGLLPGHSGTLLPGAVLRVPAVQLHVKVTRAHNTAIM